MNARPAGSIWQDANGIADIIRYRKRAIAHQFLSDALGDRHVGRAGVERECERRRAVERCQEGERTVVSRTSGTSWIDGCAAGAAVPMLAVFTFGVTFFSALIAAPQRFKPVNAAAIPVREKLYLSSSLVATVISSLL